VRSCELFADKDEVTSSNLVGPIEVKSAERFTCVPARVGHGGSGVQDKPVITGLSFSGSRPCVNPMFLYRRTVITNRPVKVSSRSMARTITLVRGSRRRV